MSMMTSKRTILIATIFLVQWSVFSQNKGEETDNLSVLFKQNGTTNIGGFGGPIIKFSEINNQLAVFTGGKGGVILNHNWVLGIEGYILGTNVSQNLEKQDLNFIYAGVFGGYIFKWNQTFHLATSLMIGWGGVGYSDDTIIYSNFEHHKYLIDDHLLILEPNLELEVNIAKHFRMGIGVQYRTALAVDLPTFNSSKLSGFSGAISFKFGEF
jgi:hypothetical protein